MILKYCLQTRKNITVGQIITYVFLFVLSIVVMLSVVEAINIPYNKYMFNRCVGSDFSYETDSSSFDMVQISNIALGNGFSEEMTQPLTALYCKRSTEASAYICENFEDLKKSYFSDNILHCDKKMLKIKDDALPAFISYDLLYELEVSEGDCIILYNYRTIYAKLRICGVLRQSYKNFMRNSEVVIMSDASLIEDLEYGLEDDYF